MIALKIQFVLILEEVMNVVVNQVMIRLDLFVNVIIKF